MNVRSGSPSKFHDDRDMLHLEHQPVVGSRKWCEHPVQSASIAGLGFYFNSIPSRTSATE